MRTRFILIVSGLAVLAIGVYVLRSLSSDAEPRASARSTNGESQAGVRGPALPGTDDAGGKPVLTCDAPNGDVARVGDASITAEHLCTWLTRLGATSAGHVDRTQARSVLDRMINAVLVNDAVRSAGLQVTEPEVAATLDRLGVGAGSGARGSASVDPAIDIALLREQARERLELELLARQRTSVEITEADVDRELAAGAPGIDRGQGVRVEGWLARLAPGADAAASAKAEQAADDFAARVASGKPDALAAKLGLTRLSPFLLSPSGLEPELEEAAFALPQGKYSAPLKTRTGWVVIRPLERIAGTKLDDKALRVRVRHALETRKLHAATTQVIEELRAKTAVEILVEL